MSRRVITSDNVLAHEFEEEAVILNLDNETYYRFNGIAMDMWQALTNNDSVDAARAQLLEQYDVEEAELTKDLDTFIQLIVDAQLAVVQD
ncbi:MAG: PqqD family protein [Anaerolineae bacterium]